MSKNATNHYMLRYKSLRRRAALNHYLQPYEARAQTVSSLKRISIHFGSEVTLNLTRIQLVTLIYAFFC